jgi:hypothetical protein
MMDSLSPPHLRGILVDPVPLILSLSSWEFPADTVTQLLNDHGYEGQLSGLNFDHSLMKSVHHEGDLVFPGG